MQDGAGGADILGGLWIGTSSAGCVVMAVVMSIPMTIVLFLLGISASFVTRITGLPPQVVYAVAFSPPVLFLVVAGFTTLWMTALVMDFMRWRRRRHAEAGAPLDSHT